jgi:hypothetical protein
MKTAIYCSVLTLVSLWTLNVFGESCQNGNGGGYPNNGGYPGDVGYPYEQTGPYGSRVPYGAPAPAPSYPLQAAGASPYFGAPVAAAAPAGPTARITVVSANASSSSQVASSVRSAKLKVIADEAPVAESKTEIAIAEPVVDEKIAGIVGTWKAVARQGDGELTTIQLHLDNRGWAELTVPGSDGKPTTTKSRVNFENEELKLTDGTDKVVSLGKLVDFNSRQMVLERAEGQVTFVRL